MDPKMHCAADFTVVWALQPWLCVCRGGGGGEGSEEVWPRTAFYLPRGVVSRAWSRMAASLVSNGPPWN